MSWVDMQPYLVGLAIGLLLGFERERSVAARRSAGSRTFALIALAGVVTASLSVWLAVAGLAGVSALMALAYLRTAADDPGTTTEVAGLVAFLLGALAWKQAALAVALAVVVAALLLSKERLHHFARDLVTEVEVEDALKFLVVAFVVLPLLPHRNLGPYGVLNPSRIWLLVVLITGIGWVGYIGVRTAGPRRGLLIAGLAGGFVSASATTASMGQLSRTTGQLRSPLAGALLASLATFVQLVLVIGVVDTRVLLRLLPAVLAGAAALGVVAVSTFRRAERSAVATPGGPGSDVEESTEPAPSSRPFALRPALVLAAVLTLALLVGRWGAAVLGPQGAVLAAGAAGLADAHAGSVAAASLAAQGDIGVGTALAAIAAALGTNLVVKAVLAFAAGGRRFGLAFVAGMAGPAVAFGVTLTVTTALAG